MATPLIISEEAMDTAKKGYDDCAARMKELRNRMSDAVDEIRGAWDSDAGKAFFEKFDDEWLSNFDDYINVIKHMSDNMTTAKNKYSPLFDEADNIKLD